jgi:hypothetical protein
VKLTSGWCRSAVPGQLAWLTGAWLTGAWLTGVDGAWLGRQLTSLGVIRL